MKMAKALPTRADLIDYPHAAAGHDGTLCDVDGELFIKPCTAQEIAFYEASAAHPDFVEFMPTFLGTLSLDAQPNGTTIEEAGAALLAKHNGTIAKDFGAEEDANGKILERTGATQVPKHIAPEAVVPVKTGKRIVTNQAVVLENAAHGFVKPNIMDVKLGVRLWADDAALEKQIRFDKVTEETTHKALGFRIAGMRVWQGEGASGAGIDVEGYRVYDKNYGRYTLHKDNVQDAFKNFISSHSAGVDEELAKLVAQAFYADVSRIQAVMEHQESRMYSASLLFVFEGDGAALRSAMEEASRSPATMTSGNDEESDEDEEEYAGPRIYAVKVIDFAHAEWVPGTGPDENSLFGVRSVGNILKRLGGC